MEIERIILFDGECNMCDHSVQFIIKRDPSALFKFASLQSTAGQALLQQYQVPADIDSFVLIHNGAVYFRSSAALHISKHLKGLWKAAYFFIIIPAPVRDLFYSIVARNRYRWFGKKSSCMLPSPDVRKRFL